MVCERSAYRLRVVPGDVIAPGATLEATQHEAIEQMLEAGVQAGLQAVTASVETQVQDALVLGIEASAVSAIVEHTCSVQSDAAKVEIRAKIIEAIDDELGTLSEGRLTIPPIPKPPASPLPNVCIPRVCTPEICIPFTSICTPQICTPELCTPGRIDLCDPELDFGLEDVAIDGPLTCSVSLDNGEMTLRAGFQKIRFIDFEAKGFCAEARGLWSSAAGFDAQLSPSVSNPRLVSVISQSELIGPEKLNYAFESTGVEINLGLLSGFVFPGVLSAIPPLNPVVILLQVAFINNVFLNSILIPGDLFGFSPIDVLFDLWDLLPVNDVNLAKTLSSRIGSKSIKTGIEAIAIDEQEIASFMLSLRATLTSAEITPSGVTVSGTATFSPTSVDPNAEPAPGGALTPAARPTPPQPGSGNTFFVISDDAFNQLFASMTRQGLKTECLPSGRTFGDVLPDDCGVGAAAPPEAVGFCEGVKLTDCESLALPTTQGVCHGAQGNDCETIPVAGFAPFASIERQACRNTPFLNITVDMGLLFCGRAEVPPALLISDDLTTPEVETHFRLNDLLVTLVLDRNDDEVIEGELNSLAKCSQAGANRTLDCQLGASCLDLNVATLLSLDTSSEQLRLRTELLSVTGGQRPPGSTCGGAFGLQNQPGVSAISNSINVLINNVNALTPPLKIDGLGFGGILSFSNPRLIAIKTSEALPGFDDYLGITGGSAGGLRFIDRYGICRL